MLEIGKTEFWTVHEAGSIALWSDNVNEEMFCRVKQSENNRALFRQGIAYQNCFEHKTPVQLQVQRATQ